MNLWSPKLLHRHLEAVVQVTASTSPPPLASDGVQFSSPIVSSKKEKLAIIWRKAQCKRAKTIAQRKGTNLAVRQAATLESAHFNEEARLAAEHQREDALRGALNSLTGHNTVQQWAVKYIGRLGILQSLQMDINKEFVLQFSLDKLYGRLSNRQVLSMLAHLRICSSYPTLARTGSLHTSEDGQGTEESTQAEDVGATGENARANMIELQSAKVAPTAGPKIGTSKYGQDAEESTQAEDVGTTEENVVPTASAGPEISADGDASNSKSDKDMLGVGTSSNADVITSTPCTSQKILLHKTEVFPLPAMNIDKSKTTGNAKVMKAIFSELGNNMTVPDFLEMVRLVFGDQLSIA
ncbi:hypothetical protein OBBRIDRAFT_800946 [Obba rivulosa]|uniref:DUF6589 domain-containing protein n=1 Tax=Obba rivulosa TaxID=1052685 RepID=A0A8E2J765_9APHY|nr:hypothetical protein OBBRIDRAFT_800946 [Obba rivulosa]